MKITEAAKIYKMKMNGRTPNAHRLQVWADRFATSRYQLPRYERSKITRGSYGIGDIVVPSTGPLQGIPLAVCGFAVTDYDPISGLPYGTCKALIVEPMYKNGMSTGLRGNLPMAHI